MILPLIAGPLSFAVGFATALVFVRAEGWQSQHSARVAHRTAHRYTDQEEDAA